VQVGQVPEWRAKSAVEEADRGMFASCAADVRRQLVETRARRLIKENELAAVVSEQKLKQQAVTSVLRQKQEERKLALFEAQDVEGLKKMQETNVLRRTETNKVAVEKAFCSLAGSGNVPSLVGGHASTVKSGSISPNSSVSEAEVRALQKGFADLRADKESLEKKMRYLKLCAERDDVIGMKATVATFEPEGCEESVGLTIPEGGVPSIWYGEGAGGYVGKDGRFHSEPEETFGYESLSF